MQSLQLWTNLNPDPELFNSTMPFCVDTMPVEQWLQFVFIPRMRVIVMRELPIPKAAGIKDYAEECYKDNLTRVMPLLDVLAQFDRFFAEESVH